jgi:hypothetical protein
MGHPGSPVLLDVALAVAESVGMPIMQHRKGVRRVGAPPEHSVAEAGEEWCEGGMYNHLRRTEADFHYSPAMGWKAMAR